MIVILTVILGLNTIVALVDVNYVFSCRTLDDRLATRIMFIKMPISQNDFLFMLQQPLCLNSNPRRLLHGQNVSLIIFFYLFCVYTKIYPT